jgi:branched-chain amino acid transport system ATP-binding protein
MSLLAVEGVSLSFQGVRALDEVTFTVARGEICALIGPNGAGKSSLLNVISGLYHAQAGSITFDGERRAHMDPYHAAHRGIARTFQNGGLFKHMSVVDNLLTGRNLVIKSGLVAHALAWPGARREEREQRGKINKLLGFLDLRQHADTLVGKLPYGLQKRVELGRALAAEPKLLLLDEPMAGMNAEEKRELGDFIRDANQDLSTTVVLIEHDMGMVMDLSDHVVVLDYGRKIGDGTPDEVRGSADVVAAYLGAAA